MEMEKNKIQWLEFDLLREFSHISGGVFLRHGGTSIGAFSHLNMGGTVGDHPDCVKVNRDLMLKQMGVSNYLFAKQVHKDTIIEVTASNLSKLPEADGLITKEKDLAIGITHADCQAALFYDPEKEIIGVVHAGWRGLVKNIYQKMVERFKDLGSKEENIIVCISPSLGPEYAEFKDYQKEFPKELWSYQVKPFYFNLWELAKAQLKEAKIKDKNVELIEECTFSNPKDYYSYRREKITGRHATVIAIKK